MLAGIGWWVYAAATAEPPKPPAATSPLAGGLVAGGARSAEVEVGSADMPPAPILLRLSTSFVGGFFIGWLLRRFLMVTFVVGGALVLGIAVLKGTGVIDLGHLDWASVEQQVDAGLGQVKEQTTAAAQVLRGYLPSAASAVVGGFFGFRR